MFHLGLSQTTKVQLVVLRPRIHQLFCVPPVSGRSSAYGDTAPESATTGARSETSSVGMPSSTMQPECCEGSDHAETDFDTSSKLHALRLALLQRLVQYLPGLRDIGGMRTIPFMQVGWGTLCHHQEGSAGFTFF